MSLATTTGILYTPLYTNYEAKCLRRLLVQCGEHYTFKCSNKPSSMMGILYHVASPRFRSSIKYHFCNGKLTKCTGRRWWYVNPNEPISTAKDFIINRNLLEYDIMMHNQLVPDVVERIRNLIQPNGCRFHLPAQKAPQYKVCIEHAHTKESA